MLGGLEGALHPACEVGEGLSNDEDVVLLPRSAHRLHYFLDVVSGLPVVVSPSEGVFGPVLVHRLLDVGGVELVVSDSVHSLELPDHLANEFSGAVVVVLGLDEDGVRVLGGALAVLLAYLLPVVLLEVFLEGRPVLGGDHVVVGG